jgi:hypothetical protein
MIMKKAKSISILLAAAAALACAAAPRRAAADPRNPKPDWVDGASVEYPREKYVVGVGAADDRATAEERSRGEIAKVFSANVTVDSSLSETETNVTQGAASKNNFSQSVTESVKTTSKKVLEGVQVVENWQDGATKVYYTLAVLERAKAHSAMTDKIGALDAQAQQYKQQMDAAGGKMAKAAAAMKVLRLLKARNELNGELRVVDETGQGIKSGVDEAALKPEAAKAVGALDVAVDMTGDGSEEVETALLSGLNAFGLHATKGGKGGDMGVEGHVDSKPMQGDGSKWQWARSTVTVTLKEPSTSKVIARFDASDREASADYPEAVRRSHVELAKRVSEKLSSAITAYFENN